jgi:hypothetical protein
MMDTTPFDLMVCATENKKDGKQMSHNKIPLWTSIQQQFLPSKKGLNSLVKLAFTMSSEIEERGKTMDYFPK